MSIESFLAQAAEDRRKADADIAEVQKRNPSLTLDEAEMYHILSASSQYGGPSEKRFQRFCALHKLGIEQDDDGDDERGATENAYRAKRGGTYEPIIRWKWDWKTRTWYDPKTREDKR